jgi:hypothetical protein
MANSDLPIQPSPEQFNPPPKYVRPKPKRASEPIELPIDRTHILENVTQNIPKTKIPPAAQEENQLTDLVRQSVQSVTPAKEQKPTPIDWIANLLDAFETRERPLSSKFLLWGFNSFS